MKIVNIVLSVLILLLALASAVFSFFLFEKRNEFVDGWKRLSETIHMSSAELDKTSGTSYAKDLSPEALAHENYSELPKKLPNLVTQSKQVIVARDHMADGFIRIGAKVNMSNRPTVEKLRNIDTSGQNVNAVVNAVTKTIGNRDQICGEVRKLAQKLQLPLNVSELTNGNFQVFGKMGLSLDQQRQSINLYNGGVRKVAAILRATKPNFSTPQTAIKTLTQAANNMASQTRRLEADLSRAKSQVRNLEAQVKERDRRVSDRELLIAARDRQIKDYKRVLGMAADAPAPQIWGNGSVDARNHLEGRITEISQSYGYVAVNLGKNSIVQQTIGNRKVDVNLNIEPGLELVVVRPVYNQKYPKFIARLTMDKVGDDVSTANLPAKGELIKVGDKVFFNEDAAKAAMSKAKSK